jgi:hypothetical protein
MVRRHGRALLLVVIVVLVPFARGLASGNCFFWRDLAHQFFPTRLYVLEGLRDFELRYWNPWAHEGEPMVVPPVSYLPDVLQVLAPHEHGLSWSLALHVALAAATAYALAVHLGAPPLGAAAAALVYALGGFVLSSLNLYVHLQAEAWAPLVVLQLRRVAREGLPAWAGAALVLALATSTLSVEIVAQAVVVGAVLGLPPVPWRHWRRDDAARWVVGLLVVVAVAGALVAPTVFHVLEQVKGSGRGGGLPLTTVFERSLHPAWLAQVLVADFHGELGRHVEHYWALAWSEGRLPYFSSLYMGALALGLAVTGLLHGAGPRRRLGVLAALGLLVALGQHARLDVLAGALPARLLVFRFPVKAFFTVHLAVALLAAGGVGALVHGDRRAWRIFAGWSAALAFLLLFVPLVPAFQAALTARMPESFGVVRRAHALATLVGDARVGGLVMLAGAMVGGLAWGQRLASAKAGLALVALLGADLVRTGAGVNPMVTPDSYRISPEGQDLDREIRASGTRAFTCEPEFSARWRAALGSVRSDRDAWVAAVTAESLAMFSNVPRRVPTAFSVDQTGFAPQERLMSDPHMSCDFLPEIVPRLRGAGVGFVLSFDPRDHPDLELRRELAIARIAPLTLHVYTIRDAWPLRVLAPHAVAVPDLRGAWNVAWQRPGAWPVAVEGLPRDLQAEGTVLSVRDSAQTVRMEVTATAPAVVVVRDGFSAGWRATVNGQPAPIMRADGRHRAVTVPAGSSDVVLWYEPPGVRAGMKVLAIGLIALGVLGVAGRRSRRQEAVGPGPSASQP